MADETTTETYDLAKLIELMRMKPNNYGEDGSLTPAVSDQLTVIHDDITDEERFVSSLATVLKNMDPSEGRFDKQLIQDLIGEVEKLIDEQLGEIFAAKQFKALESVWRSLEDLVDHTDFSKNIKLSLLDVSKDEAFEDLEMNSADIAGSEFFKKIYLAEYDQYGGQPYGGIVGMYEFGSGRKDMLWLQTMGKIATVSHAPFLGSVSADFFGADTMAEVNQFRDLESMLATPRYRHWNNLRDTEEAAYLGLVTPRVIVRAPYDDKTNPAEDISFNEKVSGDNDEDYLWGSAAMLFARNLVRSFATTGWCQYIRGPKAGGLIENMPAHQFTLRGENQLKPPVEITMPDYREYELARCGLIPLIQKKGEATACFYSAQSIKKAHKWKDPKDSENSTLVTNLSYTFSITRIAHYIKSIMRDNIGSNADGPYIHGQIERWISRYTTSIVNPDDLTLRYYPFKAYQLEVKAVSGKVGWYHCNLTVLPHIQFEGMDVDLRVDARLG